MKDILGIKKAIWYLLVIGLFVSLYPKHTIYAETLPFYNETTGKKENYTGKQVTYTYNGRTLSLSYPGIIVDGIALADYKELFIYELGLQGNMEGNIITITDGETVVKMTVGSNKATINGTSFSTGVAPVRLSFGETQKVYVPTRFVTEAFGLHYMWVSTQSTARITKPLELTIDNENVTYNGSCFSVSYNEQEIPLELPMIYYKNFVIAPAQQLFEAIGCYYEKTANTILVSKGNITIHMELDSQKAYVNGKKYIVGMTPFYITEQQSQKEYLYVSLEFVAKMLGFELIYNEYDHRYTLIETEKTGNTESIPEQPIEPEKYYFEWVTSQEQGTASEKKYLTEVKAYSVEQADVLELYGIRRSDINDFYDNGALVMEMDSVFMTTDTQFYTDYSNPYLVHVLLTEVMENARLFIMTQADVVWTFDEKVDCVRIFFTNNTTSQNVSDSYSPTPTPIPVTEEEFTEDWFYPDDVLVIPLPETMTLSQITDQDNYLEKNFQIILSGNQTEYLQEHPIKQPYFLIDNYHIAYDAMFDQTIITFDTKIICGYQYILKEGYLGVIIGRPSEIYSKIVILDPGHGDSDPGAKKGGYQEKDINFTILYNYTKNLFENTGIKAYMTRETDVLIDLYDRAAFASEIGADLFLSLHMNANNSSSVSGTEVFYSSYNNPITYNGLSSYQLAKYFAGTLSTTMKTKNRGASDSEFVVVKYNTVPAILIELGFMTNKSELAKLTDVTYQKKAAQTIYESVKAIFEAYPTNR